MAPNLSKQQTGNIRTFVAIELPASIRATVAEVEDALRAHARVLKLVAPDLLHLTVRFLGPVPPARIAVVTDACRRAAAGVTPLSLTLTNVGSFGGAAPRVVWVGLRQDAGVESLLRLHRALEEELGAAGFGRDSRPLSPHLTIARVRDTAPRSEVLAVGQTVRRLAAGPQLHGTFEACELTVMRSDLGPAGPRYTPVAHARLAGESTSTDAVK